MALRLRRGIEAERLTITPQAGELIYTTDTKKVYVGDGLTPGGNPIDTNTGALSIDDLNDVNTSGDSTAPFDGEALVWDANNQEWRPKPVLTLETDPTVNGNIKVNIVGDDSSIIVDSENYTITANLVTTTDLTVNNNLTVTNDISGPRITTQDISVQKSLLISYEPVASNFIEFEGIASDSAIGPALKANVSTGTFLSPQSVRGETFGDIALDIQAFGYTGTNFTQSSFIKLGTDLDGVVSDGVNPGRIVFGAFNDNGGFSQSQLMVWNRKGYLGLGTNRPTHKLDVRGDASIQGYIQGAEILISNNTISTTSSNENLKLSASGTGTVELDVPTQSTVGSAGGAAALPANPDIYFKINVGGTDYVVPGFAVI